MIRFTTHFYVLDKSKAISIKIAGQTAFEAVRKDFIENKEKMASKDYELHGRCYFSQQSVLYFYSFLAFANTVER